METINPMNINARSVIAPKVNTAKSTDDVVTVEKMDTNLIPQVERRVDIIEELLVLLMNFSNHYISPPIMGQHDSFP